MNANDIPWALSICAAHVGDASELAGMIAREPIPARFRDEIAELFAHPPPRRTLSKATLNRSQVAYIRHMHGMLLKSIAPAASESTTQQVRDLLARSLKCSPELVRTTVEAKKRRNTKHKPRKCSLEKQLAASRFEIDESKLVKRLQARKEFHSRRATSSLNGVQS